MFCCWQGNLIFTLSLPVRVEGWERDVVLKWLDWTLSGDIEVWRLAIKSLCRVLGQDTLLLHYLSSPRSITGYQQNVREASKILSGYLGMEQRGRVGNSKITLFTSLLRSWLWEWSVLPKNTPQWTTQTAGLRCPKCWSQCYLILLW